MRFTLHLLLGLMLAVPSPVAGSANDLKVATWNLNWLNSRAAGDRGLPPDIRPRTQEDFDLLRQYALQLDADVIAFQEVDHRDTAARVFPPEIYAIHMTRDRVLQRVGVAIRHGLAFDMQPDAVAIRLEPDQHLRSGIDVILHLPGGPLRLLAVHLKRGCQNQNLVKPAGRACNALHEQIPPLQDWIAARSAEGTAFVVLGDFNRQMDGRDPFIASLREAAPLARATQGRSSPCWGAEAFVDHIIAGGPASGWLRPDSLRVMTYRETNPAWKERLSDHCPVSVRLALPGQ